MNHEVFMLEGFFVLVTNYKNLKKHQASSQRIEIFSEGVF